MSAWEEAFGAKEDIRLSDVVRLWEMIWDTAKENSARK